MTLRNNGDLGITPNTVRPRFSSVGTTCRSKLSTSSGVTAFRTTPTRCSPRDCFAARRGSTLRLSCHKWTSTTLASNPSASCGRLKPYRSPSFKLPAPSRRVSPSWLSTCCRSWSNPSPASNCPRPRRLVAVVGDSRCRDDIKRSASNPRVSPTNRTSSSMSGCGNGPWLGSQSKLVARGLPN